MKNHEVAKILKMGQMKWGRFGRYRNRLFVVFYFQFRSQIKISPFFIIFVSISFHFCPFFLIFYQGSFGMNFCYCIEFIWSGLVIERIYSIGVMLETAALNFQQRALAAKFFTQKFPHGVADADKWKCYRSMCFEVKSIKKKSKDQYF